ncbi:uncharacterized protein EDB91DRAFT_1083938 [Suillus paluster]|uniref:uncharacterized protein n=1 Tax=Suillus paluster TaxID=48578 RepID=UPI001B85C593|nr:uncharacterized protein EDB91DRAFT_1083938 [Suillus paluster]KAG1734934.1 hypothetical protein EDB91DRAFT_1083938 [Suillus paluster]
MSDIPPPQSMIPPGSTPSYPQLRYDQAGNALTRDNVGAWVSHPGICQTLTTDRSFWFEHGDSYQAAFIPAFQSHESTPPPLSASSSRLALRELLTTNTNMINPELVPLPHSDDMDLIDPASIAEACGYTPATKTAGAHRKAKAARGKDKEKENVGYPNPKKRSREDRDEDDDLPLSQHGWQTVHVKFGQWAKVNRWPERKLTSLETKFKQLVKTMKPTGDGTRDLHNTDYNTIEDDDSHSVNSDQIQDERASPPIQHTAIARSTPSTQRNRNEDHTNRSLATTQLFTQSQQLRDSQAAMETLHGQLFYLHARMYDIERERNRAELCIEMMQMRGSTRRQHVQMPKRKNLHQEWYPDGGGSIRWLTDEGESTTSKGPKPPRLRRCGPSRHLKYSDCPYFEDIADEPIKPIQKEGVPMYHSIRPERYQCTILLVLNVFPVCLLVRLIFSIKIGTNVPFYSS